MSIEIAGFTKADTAYDKRISFTYEGVEYRVLLHWDAYEGFDLNFLKEDGRTFTATPEWAVLWDDEDADSLEYRLDELTDEVIA